LQSFSCQLGKVTAFAGAAGVSTNQTLAWIPGAGALVAGDLIHSNAHAWLEGGIVGGQPRPDLASWIGVLKQLSAAYPAQALVYGGRGETVRLKEGVEAQIENQAAAKP